MNATLLLGQTSSPLLFLVMAFFAIVALALGIIVVASQFYMKVGPDEAIVRTGQGGMRVVTASGILVYR